MRQGKVRLWMLKIFIVSSQILVKRTPAHHDVYVHPIKYPGFKVTVVQNLRLNEFTKAIVEFAEDNGHGDIAVLVVMSHGEPGEASGKIIASDGQKVDIENDIIR